MGMPVLKILLLINNCLKMKLFIAVVIALALGFTSCSDDQTELGINYSKMTEVKGYVSTQSVNRNDDVVFSAASGLKVYVQVSYADLTGDENASGLKRFETVTDNKGMYSIQVPATDKGFEGQIFTDRIEGSSYEDGKSKEGYFKTGDYTINLKAGIVEIKDMTLQFVKRPELDRD